MTDNARTTVPVLDGRHQLTIHAVTPAPDSFDIAYSITPPLPEDPGGTDPILLTLEAEDGLGNEYTDWGGAFGLAPDGTHTEGTITGQPALPTEAGELHVRLTFLQAGKEFPHELTLRVPTDT
ncbi:hypothetical protein ACFV98_26940 [Streptomyces violascens]|uniref:hypothetical protein n=1 Tax=Streptomyces violascens TaxID=67381 RepID=UPI00365F7744